jgi:ubiquinone/menaquinone biosynthesis C-methylase UbiE
LDPLKACLVNCELFGRLAGRFESLVVPLWQGVYDSLVARARIEEGFRVLDVGAGTGEVSIRLSHLVGPKGRVVAADVQPEMLSIARRKATKRGARNVEFKVTPMEKLGLPDNSFDSVVGNYSLCCCVDYEATLAECLRVLKPGGRLTYNHGGPDDPLANQLMFRIFEGYKTTNPSKHLQEVREAEELQAEAVEKYREPFVTLDAMRGLGFREAEATLTRRVIKYTDARSFVNEWLQFDWSAEAEEIPSKDLGRFRREAVEALGPLSKGQGFTAESGMIFFTGAK